MGHYRGLPIIVRARTGVISFQKSWTISLTRNAPDTKRTSCKWPAMNNSMQQYRFIEAEDRFLVREKWEISPLVRGGIAKVREARPKTYSVADHRQLVVLRSYCLD